MNIYARENLKRLIGVMPGKRQLVSGVHVDFDKQSVIQSATSNDSKCKNCTFEELAIIQEIKKNPAIT